MTCIVGYVEGGVVHLGADSLGVGGNSKTTRADKKVFRRGPFVIGFTTSFRMGQILQYQLVVPEQKENVTDHEFMCTVFIDACRKVLMECGMAKSENEVETAGTFLVGYRGNLYTIEADYQVGMTVEAYDSVGCGSDLALGAMHALSGADCDPYDRIQMALEAAENFSSGVGGPFHFISSHNLNKE